jgi:PAS domain S-box-containing protein
MLAPFTWSIRQSLTVIVLLATLPAMVIIAITGVESKRQAEQDAHDKALGLVRSLASMQRGITNEAKVLLSAIAQTKVVLDQDYPACDTLFSTLYKSHPDFFNILLTNQMGTVVASGKPKLIGLDLSEREYFTTTSSRKLFAISGYIKGITTDQSLQVFSFPASDEENNTRGVLMLALLNSKYEELISEYKIQSGSRVTFVDSKGIRILSLPEHEVYPKGQAYNPELWKNIIDSNSDEWTYLGKRLTGENVLFAFSRLRLSPTSPPYMTIVVSIPEEEVFKEANALLLRNIGLVALTATLALIITWLIGNAAILRSLRGLMSATARLGAGDLTARADIWRGGKELRQLSGTFNEMARALENRQEELRKSADTINSMRILLNNILESMPSAIIGLDKNALVTHWNRGAEKLTGCPQKAVLGKPLKDVFPWLFEHMHGQGCASDTAPIFLEKLLFPGENLRHVDVLSYPLASNGSEGTVIRIDDVSRRVQLEEMVVQTEKMSTVGSLAAGMAHDINNPLAGILQSVQNILRRVSPDLKANIQGAQAAGCDITAIRTYLDSREILSFLGAIKESGERARKIVKNMLGFIRRSPSDHTPVSLPELVDRTLDIASTDYDLKKQYDFRRIEIIREYQPDMPTVLCSPSEIEQVVYNLVTNAAQAMFTLSRPPRLILRVYQEDYFGVIEVEDNGPGMGEDIRKRVFDPLFSTKSPGEGTGLGLAVAYFIVVNSYRGELRVDSQEGQGAKFSIRLPLSAGDYPS